MKQVANAVDETALLEAIRDGDASAWQQMYLEHREDFVRWTKAKFSISTEEALDVYQDTLIALHENIVTGKLVQIERSLRTYLFGIGKYKLIHRFRSAARFTEIESWERTQPTGDDPGEPLELDERQQALRHAISQLSQTCQKLLELYYYRRFSTEAIAAEMGYNSTDVVKTQKSRCMRKLRTLIKTHYPELNA